MPPTKKKSNARGVKKTEDEISFENQEPEQNEEDSGITYYMDEDGHYYYQTADQDLVSLSNGNDQENNELLEGQILTTDGNNFQNVTIMPADNGSGEVSYILVVQDDTKPVVGLKEEIQQRESKNDVYKFGEDEERKGELELEPRRRGRPRTRGVIVHGKRRFNCSFCTYTSHRRYLLLRHMKSHSDDRPLKCTVCERGFKTRTSLINHMNMHNGRKPHICKYCAVGFTTSGEMIRHIRYKHTNEKPHKCNECDYASVELSKLRRHIRCHTGERPYQCPHCTYASPDSFKLKRHLRIHTGEKPYKCDLCNMAFTQSNSLKTHKMIHNVWERPVFACELCPSKCGRKTDLRIHIQKMHTSDVPLTCNKCGKSLPDRYSYKTHIKSHDGEKCYKCDICPFATTIARHLKSHILKHTGEKPFVCDLCEQSFRQKQLLRRHQNLYHNPDYVPPKPKERNHVCRECDKAFAHKGNLIRHLAMHDPETRAERRTTLSKRRTYRKTKYEAVAESEESEDSEASAQEIVVKRELVADDDEDEETATVTVGDENGTEYVVLQVIQADDDGDESGTLVAVGEQDIEQIYVADNTMVRGKQKIIKFEDEVKQCFGFDEEEAEEEMILC